RQEASDGTLSAAPPLPLSTYRPLYWDSCGRDRQRLALPRRGPLVRRPRSRHLLSPRRGRDTHQETPAAGTDPGTAARAPPPLACQGHRQRALCGMEWRADRIGKDRTYDRGAAGEAPRQHHATYPAAHGGDLADAERSQYVAGGRLPRHEYRDAGSRLRPPPSRLLLRRCRGDWAQTKPEPSVGCFICWRCRQTGKTQMNHGGPGRIRTSNQTVMSAPMWRHAYFDFTEFLDRTAVLTNEIANDWRRSFPAIASTALRMCAGW